MRIAIMLAIALALVPVEPVAASPESDVTATVNQFVAAQNAHDANAVGKLLWDSPNFIWITRGAPIFGRQPALERFQSYYAGTWQLAPVTAEMRVTVLPPGSAAQVYVPIDFTFGPAGGQSTVMRFLANMTLVKFADGWHITGLLPIPAPR